MTWFSVRNETATTAELYFYGEIVDSDADKWTQDDICPTDVVEALKRCGKKALDIYINSPGGSVFAGFAIYNQLKRYPGYKRVHIDGLAGSIASVIAMAGDEIMMPENAYLMIHRASAYIFGNAERMLSIATQLEKLDITILDIYGSKLHLGIEIESIRTMMESEKWLTAAEAAQLFKVTVSAPVRIAACVDGLKEKYQNIPDILKNQTIPSEDTEIENHLRLEFELLAV